MAPYATHAGSIDADSKLSATRETGTLVYVSITSWGAAVHDRSRSYARRRSPHASGPLTVTDPRSISTRWTQNTNSRTLSRYTSMNSRARSVENRSRHGPWGPSVFGNVTDASPESPNRVVYVPSTNPWLVGIPGWWSQVNPYVRPRRVTVPPCDA